MLKIIKFFFKNLIYLPGIFLIICINFFFKFRFFAFNQSRIGHLVEDYYIYFNNLNNKKCIVFKSHVHHEVCNKELLDIIEKKVNFYKNGYLFERPLKILDLIRKRFSIFNNINLINRDNKRDGYLNYNFKEKELLYNDEQISFFDNFMSENQLIKNKYICLQFWDMGHLNKKFDFSHHTYRLSSTHFKNYHKSLNFIISGGYKVVRIGKNSKTKINIEDNKNFIDVSLDKEKREVLDIMLLNNCKFYISTTGGLDYLAYMFDKPMLLNSPIIDNIFCEKKNIFYLFKNHYHTLKKRNLSLEEICNNDLGFVPKTNFLTNNNIEIKDNSEDEIFDAVKDLIDLVNDEKKYEFFKNRSKKNWLMYQNYVNNKKPHLKKYYKNILCLNSNKI